MSGKNDELAPFAKRVLVAVGITAGALAAGTLLVKGFSIFLTIFAGLLLAVLLHGLGRLVASRTPLATSWSVLLVIVVILGLATLVGWLLFPQVEAQITELSKRLPEAAREVKDKLAQSDLGRRIVEGLPDPEGIMQAARGQLGGVSGMLSTTFGLLASLVLVLMMGFYMALTPTTYLEAIIKLVPPRNRSRARHVFERTAGSLRWWFVGRFSSMAAVGVLSTVGLLILGVPLAFAMGILAGLLSFIPFLGPVLSVFPPALLALTQSPMMAVWVLVLYGGIQLLEGNFITPLIQQKTVSMPAAVIVISQAILGVAGGILGVALAVPLTVVMVVFIQTLYLEPVLGEEEHPLGGD